MLSPNTRNETTRLLENKIAVVYGAAGAIGGAIAHTFAREGACVFLTGRRLAPVDRLAQEIAAGGGSAEAAEVDALDEAAIGRHLDAVIERAGRIDVSFNAIGLSDKGFLGSSLVEIDADQFSRPIADYTRSYFLTARLAARRMMPRRSGVIMTISALPARTGTRLNGGYGPAQAAKEALTRDLSFELAPHGIRVVGLRPHGLPETSTMRDIHAIRARTAGVTWEQFQAYLAGMSHAQRVMRLPEVAEMAAFLASDRASGMMGTTVNLTMGGAAD
jgi:NAD(P)-dependent dehydrogenase (short-subunit alcohol dehydrogenase family)